MNSNEILEKLSAPFPPEQVKWRVGATTADKTRGQALCYIESRDVMKRLDFVVGIDGWEDDYEILSENGQIIGLKCSLRVKVGNDWITKSGVAPTTDYEALKGAESDSLKRAAVKFGIFRYGYDIEAPWVNIEQFGKSYRIVGALPQLPEFARPVNSTPQQPAKSASAKPASSNGKPACITPIEEAKIREVFARVQSGYANDASVLDKAKDWIQSTPGFQEEVRIFALNRLSAVETKLKGQQQAA